LWKIKLTISIIKQLWIELRLVNDFSLIFC